MRPVLTAVRAVLMLLLLATCIEVTGPADATPVADAATVVTAAPAARTTPVGRVHCRIPRCYGAISVNSWNGKWGVSYNQPTRHRAVARAQESCKNHSQRYRSHCDRLIWMRNACAAAAYRVRNGKLQEYAGAWARYKGSAKAKALHKVSGPGHRYIWTWACTSRRFGRVTAASGRSVTP